MIYMAVTQWGFHDGSDLPDHHASREFVTLAAAQKFALSAGGGKAAQDPDALVKVYVGHYEYAGPGEPVWVDTGDWYWDGEGWSFCDG